MAALYRKYRPQNFSQVVGQKAIVQTLKNSVEMGNVAHAYLFCGSRGVGKTSLARILAKAVNCLNPKNGDCCTVCAACQNFQSGSPLDLIEIDAASNTGVDNIREVIDHSRFAPSVARRKVFIIDEVHMLSKGAFNALLKTLEEPPLHVIFILATTEINKVPATIISRTQRFDFERISASDIAKALASVSKQEKYKLNAESFELIAERSEGSLRDALSILDKVFSLGDNPDLLEVMNLLGAADRAACRKFVELIINKDSEALVAFLDGLQEKGTDFEVFNKDMLEYFRKMLVLKLSNANSDFGFTEENLGILSEQVKQFSLAETVRVIRLFLRAYKEQADSPNPQLPLLLAGVEACISLKTDNKPPQSSSYGLPAEQRTSSPKLTSSDAGTVQQAAFTEIIRPSAPSREAVAVDAAAIIEEGDGAPIQASQIADHWPEILAEIKKSNSPLAMIIKNSFVYSVEDGKVTFGVRFAFDKESLENLKNSNIIREAIFKATGCKARIAAKIVKKEDPIVVNAAQALADALTVFGGELVE